jgi:hypothetical protein
VLECVRLGALAQVAVHLARRGEDALDARRGGRGGEVLLHHLCQVGPLRLLCCPPAEHLDVDLRLLRVGEVLLELVEHRRRHTGLIVACPLRPPFPSTPSIFWHFLEQTLARTQFCPSAQNRFVLSQVRAFQLFFVWLPDEILVWEILDGSLRMFVWLALTCHEFKAKLSALSLAHPLRAVVEYPWGPVRAKKTLGIYATTVIFRGETKYKLRIHALNLLLEHLAARSFWRFRSPPSRAPLMLATSRVPTSPFYGVCKWFSTTRAEVRTASSS